MSNRTMKIITYQCTNPKCKDTQALRHSVDESPTNPYPYNKCKAGFGEKDSLRNGMFPIGQEIVAA